MKDVFTSILNQASEKPGDQNGEWKIFSPSNTDEFLGKCVYRYAEIDLSVMGAQVAASSLGALSLDDRFSLVKRGMEIILRAKKDLLATASKELGRAEHDLEEEWSRLEVFFAAFASENFSDCKNDEPRGITAVIGSYVWPIFYSLHFAFLNLLAGNSVIIKPSEKASLTVLKIFETLRNNCSEMTAVQVLIGDKEVGRRLACHEAISTIIFQGSFEVGVRVKQDTLSQPGKQVLLYLGAKNPAIIFKDSPVSVYETLIRDAFQGTGQDCKSVSVAFVENSFLSEFVDRFHQLCKEFKIGAPGSGAFTGPLIDGAMLDRYLKFVGISEREGARIVMRGKPLPAAGKGHYVTPTLALFERLTPEQMRKSVSLQTEILAPHLSIVGFDGEDSLGPVLHQIIHGRNVSIWTGDGERSRRLAQTLDFGSIAINQSLLKFNSWQTFQARKRSGNHAYLGRGLLSQLSHPKVIQS
ncbi:MAG: aldehyde dehydrogenase family protein [Bdellovibrionales bacterium]|nr:aldehyde dehydrogenase family protein [Oligoflexia bacterium]